MGRELVTRLEVQEMQEIWEMREMQEMRELREMREDRLVADGMWLVGGIPWFRGRRGSMSHAQQWSIGMWEWISENIVGNIGG